MKIEKIFRKIPNFTNLVLDTVLFESKYPVLFTCKNGNNVYLFICCLVNADKIIWIGTRTTYDNLIDLLENKITIREAFLNVTNNKVIIEYNGNKVDYKIKKLNEISNEFLPTEGEYMDAEDDEYSEEIAEFKKRNKNKEYVFNTISSNFIPYKYVGNSTLLVDKYYDYDLDFDNAYDYIFNRGNNKYCISLTEELYE